VLQTAQDTAVTSFRDHVQQTGFALPVLPGGRPGRTPAQHRPQGQAPPLGGVRRVRVGPRLLGREHRLHRHHTRTAPRRAGRPPRQLRAGRQGRRRLSDHRHAHGLQGEPGQRAAQRAGPVRRHADDRRAGQRRRPPHGRPGRRPARPRRLADTRPDRRAQRAAPGTETARGGPAHGQRQTRHQDSGARQRRTGRPGTHVQRVGGPTGVFRTRVARGRGTRPPLRLRRVARTAHPARRNARGHRSPRRGRGRPGRRHRPGGPAGQRGDRKARRARRGPDGDLPLRRPRGRAERRRGRRRRGHPASTLKPPETLDRTTGSDTRDSPTASGPASTRAASTS
jgi:hypothetical protein